jgi:hypothetical protein
LRQIGLNKKGYPGIAEESIVNLPRFGLALHVFSHDGRMSEKPQETELRHPAEEGGFSV